MAVAAVLGGLLGFVLTLQDPAATAEARIRLSDSVGWPEHDAVRFEVETWIDDSLVQRTQEQVGAGFDEVIVSFPRNQAYLDIRATASTDAEAVEAVEMIVAAVLQRDDEATLGPLRATVASASSSLESVNAELADARARAESGDSIAEIEQGALIWRAEELEGALGEAQRQLSERGPRIYQIGETEPVADQSLRRLRIVGVGALLAAIAAGALLTLLAARPTREVDDPPPAGAEPTRKDKRKPLQPTVN